MKEIIFESFKNLLNELSSINQIYTNSKSKKVELQEVLQAADDLLFLNHSSFILFYESVKNHISSGSSSYYDFINEKMVVRQSENKISKIEIKAIYNQLIKLVNDSESKNLIDYKAAIKKDDQVGDKGLVLSAITAINKEVKSMHNTLDVEALTKPKLKILIVQYINEIISLINSILLNDILRLFEHRKINQEALPKIFRSNPKLKENYIQKWIDCKVTFQDVKRFKNMNYWEEIMELALSDEEINKIKIHHKKIFLSTVQKLVNDKIVRLKSLPNKTIIAERNFKLINKFFNGESSTEDNARLKNVFNFNDSSKILLSYDNVQDENLSFDEFIIFNCVSGEYTSIFVAAFFIFYRSELELSLIHI